MELPEEVVEVGDYDFSEVNEYSDLHFKQLEVWARGSREIARGAALYVGLGYYDFSDEEPYIYGDQSGDVTYLQSGVEFVF